MHKNVETVRERERERERELYSRKISFISCAIKYKYIEKDGLCVKIEKFLQNSLSFLRVCEVLETKNKYA